jgi:hypothetical protein
VQSHLTTLGSTVSYIAAPDLEHHIFLSSWSSAFPNAKILAPEGLPEKRAQANAKDKSITLLNFHTIFTKKAKDAGKGKISVDPEFDADFEVEYVDSHPNKELVFFHKPSKTLIEADLLFNLPATEQYSKTGVSATSGIMTKIFGSLQNTRGDAIWQKRMLWYVFSKADRPGFNASIQRIGGWGFENVVPCHGDTILGNGKEVFSKVFQWHLAGKK